MQSLPIKKISILFLLVGCLFSPCIASADGELKAKAELTNEKGESVGVVHLIEKAEEVFIEADFQNLSAGEHAFHIHENALATPSDFASAGGHFNPHGKEHGRDNPLGRHAGDLPNVTINEQGTGRLSFSTTLVTLQKGRDNSLFQEGGTSFILHEKGDDYRTDPAGGAGARIAGGTIFLAEE